MISQLRRTLHRRLAAWGPHAWVRWARERTSPFRCPVCERQVDVFLPLYENLRELREADFDVVRRQFQVLHWNAYSCPRCGATDRDRLLALALPARLAKAQSLLDIAPSPPLSEHIRRRYQGLAYRTADLYLRGVDDRVDVESMGIYEEARFDAVLCSHVLEHVNDDRRALRELLRVTRPGGCVLVLAPIDLSLTDTLEGLSAPASRDRWRHYGQGDHVRMYSHNGLLERLKLAGFGVQVLAAADLEPTKLYQAGISLTAALFVATRPDGHGA